MCINSLRVARYLKGDVGDFYELSENAEKIYIGNEFVKEFPESKSRTALLGAEENRKEKHNIYSGCLLVNHAENGKKNLYDIRSIKKETSTPQQ